MTLRLAFKSPYLSIDPFDPVEIPNFLVLTGVNGSGKSHLMEALEKGNVVIEGIENPHIVLFNYETFKLDNESAFNAHQLSSEREATWQYYQQHVRPQAESWHSNLGDTYEQLKEECRSDNKTFWSLRRDPLRQYRQHFKQFFNRPKIRDNQQAQGIFSLAKRLPYSLDEISHDDFVRLYKPYVFKNDFLPLQLGKVFWDYYVKYRGNQVNEYQNEKYGKSYEAVNEEEFVSIHGDKPWDLVNEILRTFDTLTYQVASPEGSDYFGNFQLKLVHTEKENLEIEFSHLSSGERVLMALVASVYKSSADKHFPDLLLLDEVDASLHPSMMKNMLDVIDRIFLSQGVNIILVTHSPTTIALAPEQSLFVMHRSGRQRIEKKSRQEALSILTEGFATIEQGLRLFDEVSRSSLTVITEGYNTRLIEKALSLYGVSDVEILTGVEGASGKNQLKTIFQFFVKARHEKKVVFVWDCDASYDLKVQNNTFPFVIPHNDQNTIAKTGIENAFPMELFEDFTKIITLSKGKTIREFDDTRKRDFESFLLARNNLSDFAHFSSLVDQVKRISAL